MRKEVCLKTWKEFIQYKSISKLCKHYNITGKICRKYIRQGKFSLIDKDNIIFSFPEVLDNPEALPLINYTEFVDNFLKLKDFLHSVSLRKKSFLI